MARNSNFGNFIGKNANVRRCVMIIDGKVINGSSNVTVIDGQIIGAEVGNSARESRSFDEKKIEDARKIEKITINSSAVDVNISLSNSSNHVEVRFHGNASVDGDVEFKAYLVDNEFRIIVDIKGCCFNSNLNLDVTVPTKEFQALLIKTISGNVNVEKGVLINYFMAQTTSGKVSVEKGVLAKYVTAKTVSGRLSVNANFAQAKLDTTSGKINLCTCATQDISITATTISGDILAEFNCVRKLNLSTRSMSGDVTNCHRNNSNGFVADVDISTISGDIRIR